MKILVIALLSISFLAFSCTQDKASPEDPIITKVQISLDSAEFQKVYDFVDNWQQDSLLPYLSHRDPSFRVLATYGFAGMLDEAYIDTIGSGVMDPVMEVRRAAAYTLGQSYNTRAVPFLMNLFEYQDSLGIDPLTFKYALEAVGKCADSSYLPLLASISTYQPRDTLLLEGQCLGLLNMAERGFSNQEATKLMVHYATDKKFSSSVRLIAANYIANGKDQNLSVHADSLITAFGTEDNPEIRMFIGKAIGKIGTAAGTQILKALRNEQDERVRIELLRGSADLPIGTAHRIWTRSLRDKNDLVAMTAAELIVENGTPGFSQTYINWAFANYRPVVYARILAAGNKYISNSRFRKMVQELIFQRIRSTSNPYLKSDFILAAGQQLSTARQLINYDNAEAEPIVRTSILDAITHAVEKSGTIGLAEKNFIIRRWKSGDVAAVSILSGFIAENKALFPVISSDEKLWKSQSDQIKIPQEIEARIQIDKAREKLFDFKYNPNFYRTSSYHTHDIDWSLYEQLPDQPRAEIETSAGLMTIALLKEAAPATVLNFIQLSQSGYYTGKTIHRVVPNFVIQGGGNRGDGYGSLDHFIRSELAPYSYNQTGMVGMASAGLHTESQQWFITLRPALHLNGHYTIFARLISGEDVLRSIRRGDVIKNIRIF